MFQSPQGFRRSSQLKTRGFIPALRPGAVFGAVLSLSLFLSSRADEPARTPAAGPGAYLAVHGLRMYYEAYGKGPPLLLLHGGMQTIDTSFSKQIPAFSQSHRVIAPEQMGHGHTGDADREFSYS